MILKDDDININALVYSVKKGKGFSDIISNKTTKI